MSCPEFNIQGVIVPLTSLQVSLHDQSRQKEDIADYVRSVVYSNSESIIRRWKKEDKDLVIKGLFGSPVLCQLRSQLSFGTEPSFDTSGLLAIWPPCHI
jgi:hypothetical protein